MTSLCSFLLNDNIIIIGVYNKIFIYFISENKFERFFFDEELIFGKELSDNRFILIFKENIIKLFEIDDENNVNVLLEKNIF